MFAQGIEGTTRQIEFTKIMPQGSHQGIRDNMPGLQV